MHDIFFSSLRFLNKKKLKLVQNVVWGLALVIFDRWSVIPYHAHPLLHEKHMGLLLEK